MQEPSVRSSRLAIAATLIAVIAIGGTGFFLGRATAPTAEPAAPPPIIVPPPVVRPEPVRALGRAELIGFAQRAADAFASGESLPDEIAKASGQRFVLVIPFGCAGPAGEGSNQAMRWHYDEADQALRISVAPVGWRAIDWGFGASGNTDVAEGFWISRPWSTSENCPPRAGQPVPTGIEPITLPGQSLAIAQFFSKDANRDARRDGRPFKTVQRVPADRFDGSQGFRLRISGRIGSVPGSGPVHCVQSAGVEQRPICVIGASFDEVRIENAATGDVLATWPIGRSRRADS